MYKIVTVFISSETVKKNKKRWHIADNKKCPIINQYTSRKQTIKFYTEKIVMQIELQLSIIFVYN